MRRGVIHYLIACAAVAVAATLRLALVPLTGLGAPWVVFFTAVVLVALYLGRGPALLATLLGALTAMVMFVLPSGYSVSQAVVQAVLWTIDGLILIHLATLITRGRAEAEAAGAALQDSEERLRLATEAAHIGSYDIDVATGTIVCSPELHALLGTHPDGQRVELIFNAVHAENAAAMRAAYERSLDPAGRGGIELETRIMRPDGTTRWISWVGQTHFDARETGRVPVRQVGVAVDITERRLAESELRQLNQNKDEFLAMLSHELRNPLAAIRTGVSVLEHARTDSDASRRAQGIIERQVTQLTRLTDDLLDATRIARGKLVLKRERLELGELVRRVVDDQRPFVDAHGLVLEHASSAEDLWIEGDSARITQVVHNLLHNAIKFTPTGGRISVAVERDGDAIVIRVRDTGAGLPPEATAHIFEPFFQLGTSHGRSEGGLGLGLALVKGIVEQHGGTVAAASVGPGYGAELTVRLPSASAPERTAPAKSRAPMTPRRVLLIDDNSDVAETMHDVLALIGHDVRIASDGRSGIAAAIEFEPDVVLCDIGLPDIDGYEVARQIRGIPALHDTVLVALSGYGRPEDRERATQAGFARLVTKPATLDVLRSVIGKAA